MALTHRLLVGALAASLIVGGVAAQEPKPPTIAGWGTVTDPDGDCAVQAEKGKLTVTVPEGTHDLNPNVGDMKAPRVLREIEGDFTALVKVTGDFTPGDKAAADNTSSFNGAGLLVWQDAKNYLRLERNAWWRPDLGKYGCYPPLVEYYKDGEYQNTNPGGTVEEFFKGRSTWLKVERRGDKLTASYSHDGKEWTVAKELTVNLARKVKVGVAAVNTAARPFAVEFEEFMVATK